MGARVRQDRPEDVLNSTHLRLLANMCNDESLPPILTALELSDLVNVPYSLKSLKCLTFTPLNPESLKSERHRGDRRRSQAVPQRSEEVEGRGRVRRGGSKGGLG